MNGIRKFLRRLRANTSGLALTEMALSAPFVLTGGLWGVETANFAIVNMKVSQVALHIADNAARIGDTSTLQDRKIYESDIEDLFFGAYIQGGEKLDFFEHGRAILSSFEEYQESDHCGKTKCDPPGMSDGEQFIHWQRCMGKKKVDSTYGDALDVIPAGIGPSGREVLAISGRPVMFVQVFYDYQPLISDVFVSTPTIEAIGAYPVRSDRDLTEIYTRGGPGIVPGPPAKCNLYKNPYTFPGKSGGAMGGGSTSTSSGGSSGSSSTSGGSTTTSGGSTSTTSGGSTTTSGGSTSTTSGGSTTTSGGSTSTTSGGSTTTSGGSTSTTSGGGGGGGGGGGASSTGGTSSGKTAGSLVMNPG